MEGNSGRQYHLHGTLTRSLGHYPAPAHCLQSTVCSVHAADIPTVRSTQIDTNQAKPTRQHPPDAVSRPHPILLLRPYHRDWKVWAIRRVTRRNVRHGTAWDVEGRISSLLSAQKPDSGWNMQYGHTVGYRDKPCRSRSRAFPHRGS